ncbi:MAG: hypothetical protein ACJ74Y_01495 [Bryobacteraceae bacterium]
MRKITYTGAAVLSIAAFVNVHAGAEYVNFSTNQAPAAPPPGAPVSAPRPASAGLENPWDVRKIIGELQNDTSNLQPLLRKMNPQEWYDKKGAPTTYILQWQSAGQQMNNVLSAARLFAQKTDSLSLALDTYFRLEALEVTERALAEGVGRYDTAATARELNALIAHNFASRERIRGYIRDLAATTEENFKIADSEAQRCREMISKQPVSSQARKSKKD